MNYDYLIKLFNNSTFGFLSIWALDDVWPIHVPNFSHQFSFVFTARLPPSLYFLTDHRSVVVITVRQNVCWNYRPSIRQIIMLCSSSLLPMTTLFTNTHTQNNRQTHALFLNLWHTRTRTHCSMYTNTLMRSEIKPTNKMLCLDANNT